MIAGARAIGALGILALLFIELLAAIVRSTRFLWNEIRLSRSLALTHGYPLYPARDALGPVIGTLHTPVSHYLYLLVCGFRTPTSAVLAASVLCFLLVFSALTFVVVYSSRPSSREWFAIAVPITYCLFLIMETAGTYNAVFMVHADAAALGFATLACGVFCNPKRPITLRQVWFSGAACVLATGCKQLFAFVALGILLFLAATVTWKYCVHFVAAVTLTGTLLFAAFLLIFPVPAFLFNTVTLASHRPLKQGYIEALSAAFRDARLDALPALLPIAFFVAYSFFRSDPRPRMRVCFAAHRWLVFVMASAALLLVSFKSVATVGADVNHLGAVLYLIFVAAALAIQEALLNPAGRVERLSAGIFAALGIFVSLAPGTLYQLATMLPAVGQNASEIAYRYEIRHPGETWFPWNPMSSLLTNGKLYHLDSALYDRELAGYPLSAVQLDSGLPPGFRQAAIPPGESILSAVTRQRLAGATVRRDPELPGWTVYQLPH